MLISANNPDSFISTDFGLIFPQVFFKLGWAVDQSRFLVCSQVTNNNGK